MPQARQILWPLVPNAPEPDAAEAELALLVVVVALAEVVFAAALEEEVALADEWVVDVDVSWAVLEATTEEERVLQRVVSRFLRAMGA